MATISVDLSGTSIYECLSSRLIDDVENSDFFLVSQQVLSSVSPTRRWILRDQILTNELRSMRSSYEVLSSSILEDLKKAYKFGSMAWESSADYSLEGHVHQYSHLSVIPTIKRSDYDAGKISALATFTIDGRKSALYCPKIRTYNLPSPYIGQLKFLGTSTLLAIDEMAESFDGWVYPDGREISREIFVDAFNAFGEDYGSGDGVKTFNIPALSSFFKPIVLTSDADQTRDLSKTIPVNEVVKSHHHTLANIPIDGKMKCNFSFTHVNDTRAGDACHGTNGSNAASQEYDIQIKFTGLEFSSDSPRSVDMTSADMIETHPTYNWIPALMYIGLPKKVVQ